MTEIKDGAFTNCSGVTTFDLGDGSAPVAWYDYSFAGSRPGRNSVPLFYSSGPVLMSGAGQESSLCRVAPAARGAVSITHINASRIFAGCSGLSCVLFCGFPAFPDESDVASWSLPPSVTVVLYEGDLGAAFASKFSKFSVAVLSAAGEVVSFSPLDPSSVASMCGLSARGVSVSNPLGVSGIQLDHVYGPDGRCAACGAFDPNFVPVTGVTLSESMKSLEVGNTFDLVATVSPAEATRKSVTWSSSDESVADVSSDGCVTAMGPGEATITVTTEEGGFTARCDVTVTETAGAAPFLETTVDVNGHQQRLRVYDNNKILPAGAQLKAEAVTGHKDMDNDYEVEHLLAYNIWLEDSTGTILEPPFSNTVELCFEVLDFLDEDELETVLVQQFDDREFNETPVERDGARWVLINTDHFSPYALIDKLTDADKGVQIQPNEPSASSNSSSGYKNNVATGDHATHMAVASLGMVLVLALGIMLRLITGKKTFDE